MITSSQSKDLSDYLKNVNLSAEGGSLPDEWQAGAYGG